MDNYEDKFNEKNGMDNYEDKFNEKRGR